MKTDATATWSIFLSLLLSREACIACSQTDENDELCLPAAEAHEGHQSLLQKQISHHGSVQPLEHTMLQPVQDALLQKQNVEQASAELPSGGTHGLVGKQLGSGAAPQQEVTLDNSDQHVSAALRLYVSSVISSMAQDTVNVLGIEYLKKLTDPPWVRTLAWTITPIVCCGIVYWVYRSGGIDLISNVLPVGIASTLCLLMSFICIYLGKPWSHFSPTSALITVVFVLEMSSFERFIIKNSLRLVGTCVGGFLAFVCAEVSDLTSHSRALMLGFIFSVFTIDAKMAKTHKEIAYVFSMISVTFALVFFGYLQTGFSAVWSRFLSVLMGECTAFAAIATMSVARGEWHTARSAGLIFKKCDQILGKVLVAMDFAFARNMIVSQAEETVDISEIKEHAFCSEVREYFNLDKMQDAEELKSSTLTSSFATLPVDLQVAGLHAECQHLWGDLEMVRAVIPQSMCGYRLFFELPNIGLVIDRVQPVYIQASALAHAAPVDPKVWQEEEAKLLAVRQHIRKVEEPLSRVAKLQVETTKNTRTIFETAKLLQDSFLTAFKDVADALQAAGDALKNVKTQAPAQGAGHAVFWRFDSFCQSLDIIIAELSSLSFLMMKLMKIKEEDNSIKDRLKMLASINFKEVDESELCHTAKNFRKTIGRLISRTRTWDRIRGGHQGEDDE